MQKGEYSLDELINRACKYMDIPRSKVLSNSRKQEVVAVKRAVSIVGYFYLEESQSDIARALNYADHGTVNHHCKLTNMDKHSLDALRYLLNDVPLTELSILALKVARNPDNKKLRLKLKQLL